MNRLHFRIYPLNRLFCPKIIKYTDGPLDLSLSNEFI